MITLEDVLGAVELFVLPASVSVCVHTVNKGTTDGSTTAQTTSSKMIMLNQQTAVNRSLTQLSRRKNLLYKDLDFVHLGMHEKCICLLS